jgi:thymidylate synthase (FAD)
MSYDGPRLVLPTVRLIASTDLSDGEIGEFLGEVDGLDWWETTGGPSGDTASGDLLPELAGRICYDSYKNPRPGGNVAYLCHLKEVGHGSVLEHSHFTLLLTGVSRSLTHELVRHRAGMGYSQESQRYVDATNTGFVVPPELADEVHLGNMMVLVYEDKSLSMIEQDSLLNEAFEQDPIAAKYPSRVWHKMAHVGSLWLKQMEASRELYGQLTNYLMEKKNPLAANLPPAERTELRKAARQAARSVLPNAAATKIVVTGNARAWRHFIEQRGSRHADAEIRRLARLVWEPLHHAAPNLFGDYNWIRLPDGSWEANTPTRKV